MIPFACVTTSTGASVLRANPSIVCDSSDASYGRMQVVGALTLVLYGLGVPVLFGVLLRRQNDAIHLDQEMRARGEGETSLTNPHIHVRRRFRKLYEDYKPQFKYWRLVLIGRKFCLALVGVVLAKNPTLQVR